MRKTLQSNSPIAVLAVTGKEEGPQHPVTGSGGFILYRWWYYREDCLIEAACKGWQIGLMNPHIM
jgi:hypothetical protein